MLFTNLDCSLGAIYIVRDPRNVVTSFSKYRGLTNEEMADFMIKGSGDGPDTDGYGIQYIGSWKYNFNSWKSFKSPKKYLLIKYEDLVEIDETFLEIFNFINKLNKSNLIVDKKRGSLSESDFELLKKKEANEGFIEAPIDKNSKKEISILTNIKKQ